MSTPPSEYDGERDNENKPQRKRATQRGPFVGDAAAVELRNRLARENDQAPLPPPADSAVSMSTATGFIGAITIITAAAAVRYLCASASPPSLIPEFPASEAPSRNQAAAPATLAPAPRAPPQLLVSAERAQQAGQAAPLAISARGVEANASVVIAGLAPGSTMSAG